MAPCSAPFSAPGSAAASSIGGRVLLGGANAIAGEWGHNPLPGPCAERIAGAGLLLRAVAAASRRFCPGPGSPPIICRHTGAAAVGRARSRPGAAAGRPIAAATHRALCRAAGPRAGARHQSARSGRDRARRRPFVALAPLRGGAAPLGPLRVFRHGGHPAPAAAHGDASGVRGAAWLWPPDGAGMSARCR